MAKDIKAEVQERTNGTGIGNIYLDGLTVRVRVLDAKTVVGRIEVLVTPIEGSGERWVNLDSLVPVVGQVGE